MTTGIDRDFEFRFIVQQADDGKLEAWCIDSGAVGVGDTVLAALADMMAALEAMYQVSRDGKTVMTADPTKKDLALFSSQVLSGGVHLPPHIVGAGLVSRRVRRERGRRVHVGFEPTSLHVRRAA